MDKMYNFSSKKNIACIVMASGQAKRFGSNKLCAPLCQKPLVLWAAENAQKIFPHTVVVTNHTEVADLCEKNGIACLLHSFTARNHTVRLGIEYSGRDFEGYIFCQGDQPLLTSHTLHAMAERFEQHGDKIIRLEYNSTPSSPVIFPKWAYDELLNLPEGKGGNVVVKNNLHRVISHPAQSIWETMDIDTPQDMEEMEKVIAAK